MGGAEGRFTWNRAHGLHALARGAALGQPGHTVSLAKSEEAEPGGRIVAAFAVAHRGLSSEKTENTLAAFGAAVAQGFVAVEMDLQTSADGQVVVFHDDDVKRLTGANGRIDQLPYSKILELDTPDGRIPGLADVLSMLKLWDGLLNLEFKTVSAVSPTIELVKIAGLESRVLLSSMDPDALTECRRLAPTWPRALIPIGPVDEPDLEAAKELECAWLNVDHDFVDEDDLKRIKAHGFRVGFWTVNDAERAQELSKQGADCIITDMASVAKVLPPGPASW